MHSPSDPATLFAPLYSSLGDDEVLGGIVTLFVEEMADRVANLGQCWKLGDREELARAAHQLKGAAGSYGFGAITPYAAQLETTARFAASPEEVERALEQLIAICQSTRSGPTPAEAFGN